MTQRVTCIDDNWVKGSLTCGKTYEVLRRGSAYDGGLAVPSVLVKCDDGVDRWYPEPRFQQAEAA